MGPRCRLWHRSSLTRASPNNSGAGLTARPTSTDRQMAVDQTAALPCLPCLEYLRTSTAPTTPTFRGPKTGHPCRTCLFGPARRAPVPSVSACTNPKARTVARCPSSRRNLSTPVRTHLETVPNRVFRRRCSSIIGQLSRQLWGLPRTPYLVPDRT